MNDRNSFVRGLAFVALALLGSFAAPAQARAQDFQISFSPAAATFASPGVADFDAGWKDHGGLSVTVQSSKGNRTWSLYLRSLVPNMGGWGKPVGQLLYRVNGSTTWTPVTTTDQLIHGGRGTETVIVYFRVALSWAADLPANYLADLQFTASY